MRRFFVPLAILATLGCGPSTPSVAPTTPDAMEQGDEGPKEASAMQREWQSAANQDHPLVGAVLDLSTGQRVDEATLLEAMGGVDYVLLGETHDNADHHVLQAHFLSQVGAGRELVAWEQIERELDPATREALDAATSAAEVDAALNWAESGWPAFELYAPVFTAALELKLPLRGGGLTRKDLAPLFSGGEVDPELSQRFGLDEAVPPDTHAAWLDELFDVHCGAMPRETLEPMLTAQRLRDAAMTEALLAGAKGVLIAGSGHIRKDRAVPAMLKAKGHSSLSLAFIEVNPEETEPADYAELPYDFLVLTPGKERPDPCERMKAQPKSVG